MKFQWRIIMAFAAIYIIWGSTYLAILWVISDIPPILMSGIRFIAAGTILFGWCVLKREKLPNYNSFVKNAICGILMLFCGSGAVAWSEQYVPSGLAAVIVTTEPFLFILLDKPKWTLYFSNKLIIPGLLAGFAGVMLLVASGTDNFPAHAFTHNVTIGIVVIIAGAIAWTVGSLYLKYHASQSSVIMNASVQLLVAGIFSVAISLVSGESRNFNFASVHASAWIALLYLITAGSLVTYLCYLWLLKVRPAAQVSSYVYVNPIVAVLLGSIFAHEKITTLHLISLGLILAGVLMVNSSGFKRKRDLLLSAG